MRLHLGVAEQGYSYGSQPRTTGDVAEILEAKYGVIGHFVADNRALFTDQLAEHFNKAVGEIVSGRPAPADPMRGAMDRVERTFRSYIRARSLDGRVAGVPTKASLRGVSHRLKQPYKARGARPSFIDTGLYIKSFRAWIEE